MINDKEASSFRNDRINMEEAVGDFGSAIIEHGANAVAETLQRYYPEQHKEFLMSCHVLAQKKRVAKLFLPPHADSSL